MRSTDQHPLPEWIQLIYDVLTSEIISNNNGIAHEQAIEILLEKIDEEETFQQADVEYAVEQLLLRGWLYEVNGDIYITDTENID